MKRNSSIVKQLILYFLILIIFTVGAVGAYSYFRAKDALVERTFDQLISLRIEKKYRIENFFKDLVTNLELLAETWDDRQLKSEIQHGLTFPFTDSRHFYYIDIQGEVFDLSNRQPLEIAFGSAGESQHPIESLWKKVLISKGSQIEDYHPDQKSQRPAIYIGTPIVDSENRVKGMLAIEIDMEAINSIMFENNPLNGLGESGESYLVGMDFLLRSTSRFQDNSVFRTKAHTEGVRRALNGESGTASILDYRGIDVLSSYSPVHVLTMQWAILAEIDKKEAMIPIVSIRNNILYLSLLISLLAFALVYLIAKRISLPIIRLKQAAEMISSGEYDVIVNEKPRMDEIGSLENAFNEMSSKIKEQTLNLELERRMRLSSMIDGQELERHRLARELHDGLGQSVLAIKMRLERASQADPQKSNRIMKEVNELIVNVINEVRAISDDLMPAALKEFGLIDALKLLCREITESSGIAIEFHYDHFKPNIGDRLNTYLYRISQEALNNIVKHSSASNVIIDLKNDSESVYLEISDNGNGFHYSPQQKICGNGIANMKERVQLLEGNFVIISNQEEGTRISIQVPID